MFTKKSFDASPAAPASPAPSIDLNPSKTAMNKTHVFNGSADPSGPISYVVIDPVAAMKGELRTTGDVVVEGSFDGVLCARNLIVTKSGRVSGNIDVQSAQISGTLEFDLRCAGQLTVTETGRVSGKIFYGDLVVKSGGKCLGTLDDYASAKSRKKPASNVSDVDPASPGEREDAQNARLKAVPSVPAVPAISPAPSDPDTPLVSAA